MKTRTRSIELARAVGLDVSLTAPGICYAAGDPRSTHLQMDAKGLPQLSVQYASIRAGEELRGPKRLSVVAGAVLSWLASRDALHPGMLVVTEGYGFASQRGHSLGEIGGCLRKALYERGCNLLVVPPATLKKFLTGKGAGDKNVVMKAVYKRWLFDADDDNCVDAFGCAALGLVDQLPTAEQSAVEQDILSKKVERYAGKGQVWGGLSDDELARGGRAGKRKTKASRKADAV